MITNNDKKEIRLAYITDAQRALEMLATELVSGSKHTHHIWQELRNVDNTLTYIRGLIEKHHAELESNVA